MNKQQQYEALQALAINLEERHKATLAALDSVMSEMIDTGEVDDPTPAKGFSEIA